MPKIIDITGQKFNRLTAISFSHMNKRKAFWLFKCECGEDFLTCASNVKNSHTKSCGCIKKEIIRNAKYDHPKYNKNKLPNTGEFNCSICGSLESRNKHNHKYCLECASKAAKASSSISAKKYREINRDYINERRRKLHKEKPHIYRKHCKKYAEKNREELNIKKRERYNSDPQKHIDMAVNWIKKNPEYARHRNRVRKAMVRNAVGTYKVKDFTNLCNNYSWKCFYCKSPLSKETATVDHVMPIKLGGSNFIGNILPSCRSCNSSKGAKTLIEFRAMKGFSSYA